MERIVEGAETRANIVLAIRAIEVGHIARLEAVATLELVLLRYAHLMTPEIRSLIFCRMLELLDPSYYALPPWDRLLPRR